MANKILNTRLRLKYDILSNWTAIEETFIPLAGEVCVVSVPQGQDEATLQEKQPAILFKVGDGTTNFKTLPWASGLAADVHAWAKDPNKPQYAASEIKIGESTVAANIAEIWARLETLTGEESGGNSISGMIADGIKALGSASVTATGKYVTGVAVNDSGKLTVTEAALPDYTNTYAAKTLENTVSTLRSDFDSHTGAVAEYGTRITNAENAITGIKNGTNVNSFAGVENALTNRYTKGETDQKIATELAAYTTTQEQSSIDAEQDRRLGVIEGDYVKSADIANFETTTNVQKIADDLAAYEQANDAALAGVKATAEAATTVEEVDAQIDTKIAALNLATTYEPIGAEDRAKAYADGLITNANLDQYTTEQEVKDLVDTVISDAVDGDTITGLANLVQYLNTHGTEAKEMGAAIDVLEGQVDALGKAPAAGIKATDIEAWNGEIGAKALAESKTTAAEVKAQIEAYGYATTGYADGKASDAQAAAEKTASDALAKARTEITAEIDADVKIVADELAIVKETANAAAAKTYVDEELAKKANTADLAAVATSGSAYDLIEAEKDLNKTADGDVEVDCFIFYGGSASELVKTYTI